MLLTSEDDYLAGDLLPIMALRQLASAIVIERLAS